MHGDISSPYTLAESGRLYIKGLAGVPKKCTLGVNITLLALFSWPTYAIFYLLVTTLANLTYA